MKSFFILAAFSSFSLMTDNKTNLLCQKWHEVGVKSFNKEFKPIDKRGAETITFYNDGTFEKELYGTLHFKGHWLFSNDSTKLAFSITEMNGAAMKNNEPLTNKYATDSIIKLTKDTLIDGHLGYFGEKQIYGHDDIYYVREKSAKD